MMDVLIDTDALSFIFKLDSRGEAYAEILCQYKFRFIAFQTIAELEKGALLNNWGHRRRADLSYFLEAFKILYPDRRVCDLWARIIFEESRKGRILRAEDAWIAATALDIGAPLITNNSKDFQQIEGLEILTVPVNRS